MQRLVVLLACLLHLRQHHVVLRPRYGGLLTRGVTLLTKLLDLLVARVSFSLSVRTLPAWHSSCFLIFASYLPLLGADLLGLLELLRI